MTFKPNPFQVTLSDDLSFATLSRVAWKQTIAVDDLPTQLRLYRGFIEARPSTGDYYTPAVQAIESAMKQLGMDTSVTPSNRKAKR